MAVAACGWDDTSSILSLRSGFYSFQARNTSRCRRVKHIILCSTYMTHPISPLYKRETEFRMYFSSMQSLGQAMFLRLSFRACAASPDASFRFVCRSKLKVRLSCNLGPLCKRLCRPDIALHVSKEWLIWAQCSVHVTAKGKRSCRAIPKESKLSCSLCSEP